MKNKKTPNIRFPEFSGTWEIRKLGELTERVRDNDGRMNLPTLTISAAVGWLDQRERFSANIAGKEQKNYTLLSEGELSYNKGNSKLAKYGVVFELKSYKEALVPKIYHSFRVNKYSLSSFIEYMFETKKTDQELAKLISSGARMDGLLNIGYESFMGIKVNVPNILEQEKISNLISSLDTNISLQQQELNILQKTKQGFLQKMFPKEGKSLPELRFSGFSEIWESSILGEIMDVTSVKRIHQSDWTKKGIRFLRARDIVASFNKRKTNDFLYISVERYEEYSKTSGKVSPGDLLVTGVGSIGVPMLITNDEPVYFKDGNIIWFKNNQKLNGYFFYYSFENDEIQKYIRNAAGVGTVGTYTISSGKNTPISLPSFEEQIKIGNFFKQLDETIALHQQELEALQETKKAFLQKMFV